MLIAGVSVSVSESGFLAWMLNNRAALDYWVIVTVPDDVATQRLCSEHGLHCHVMHSLRPEKPGVYASLRESRLLNEGLQAAWNLLGPEAEDPWIMIFDPDLLLPPDFRARLEGIRPLLKSRMLYRLAGRRVVQSAESFRGVRINLPWEADYEVSTRAPGNFSLFSVKDALPLFPLQRALGGHDDKGRFARQFGKRISELPFSGLQLRRSSTLLHSFDLARFEGNGESTFSCHPSDVLLEAMQTDTAIGGKQGAVIQLGCWNPEVTKRLSSIFGRVFVVDTRGLSQRGTDPLDTADRSFLWRRYMEALGDVDNIYLLPDRKRVSEHSLPLADMKRGEVSAIYIDAEPHHRFIRGELLRWTSLVSLKGWIFGNQYGLAAFSESTLAVEHMLGMPDFRDQFGGWAIRLGRTRLMRLPALDGNASKPNGIVLWIYNREEAQLGLAALHIIRARWSGALCVLNWGAEFPALTLACSYYAASYISVATLLGGANYHPHQRQECPPETCISREAALLLSLRFSPFGATCLLTVGAQWFDPAPWLAEVLRSSRPQMVRTSGDGYAAIVYNALAPHLRKWAAELECQAGLFELTGEEAWRKLDSLEPAFFEAGENAPVLADRRVASYLDDIEVSVWFPDDCTIVTAVMEGDEEVFVRNWKSIIWPRGMKRLVMLAEGVDRAILPVGANYLRPLPKLEARMEGEPYWNPAIASASEVVQTRHLLYLDPCMRPMPGAELFWKQNPLAYIGSGWAFCRNKSQVLKYAKVGPPATLFNAAWLSACVKSYLAATKVASFEQFLHAYAVRRKKAVSVHDVMTSGWSVSS